MANVKKENSKTWSEEAIDKLINSFHSHECIWNVTSGDHKEQNRVSAFRRISYVSARI